MKNVFASILALSCLTLAPATGSASIFAPGYEIEAFGESNPLYRMRQNNNGRKLLSFIDSLKFGSLITQRITNIILVTVEDPSSVQKKNISLIDALDKINTNEQWGELHNSKEVRRFKTMLEKIESRLDEMKPGVGLDSGKLPKKRIKKWVNELLFNDDYFEKFTPCNGILNAS